MTYTIYPNNVYLLIINYWILENYRSIMNMELINFINSIIILNSTCYFYMVGYVLLSCYLISLQKMTHNSLFYKSQNYLCFHEKNHIYMH